MASSGVQVLRELSVAFLQCEICSGNFKEPRDLDCKHTYCLQCLTFLFEDQPRDSNSITCPSCQKLTAITEGGIRALSRNRILESLLDKITTHTEKLLRNSCAKHEGRDLALFCRKCDIAICHVCALESHPKPEHDFVPLSTVVKNHRELCNEHMRDIADEVVHDERNLKIARRKSAILREKKDEVESEIHRAAEEVMQLIKIREQELGEELDCVLETREEELHVFCKALEKKLVDNRKVMDDLRSVLERGEDTEVVNKYGEIRKKKVHKVPQAPDGLRFVSFKRDEEKITKDNLGCLREMMIPWNDIHIADVANGHDANHKEVKGKKEKSEKEASEKTQSKHEKTQSKHDKEGSKRGDSGKKQHPSHLPPTPPASPPRSSSFSIGPTPFVKVRPISQGGEGGGGGGGSGKQTLSPSSDIFGNSHQQRSHKDSLRKGIRIVDPNSNQDITELIMGDKNRNQKVKKRGSQHGQQQQPQQQKHQKQQQQQQQQEQQQQQQQQQQPQSPTED